MLIMNNFSKDQNSMKKANSVFSKKQLAIAVSAAIIGGSLVGCGGGSSSSSGGGNYTVNTSGGIGGNDGGYGGDADYVNLYNYGGTAGVQVTNSGSANASFTSLIGNSRYANPDLGDVPVTIAANTTLVTYTPVAYHADGTTPTIAAGALYVGADHVLREVAVADTIDYAADVEVTDNRYYISAAPGSNGDLLMADGAAASAPAETVYLTSTDSNVSVSDGATVSADEDATGLVVNSGVTLTLPPNDGSSTRTNVWVDNSIVNKGTIATTDASVSNRTNLMLGAANYYGANGSHIDTAGHDDVRNGGYVNLNFWTSFVSSTDINASGVTDSTGDTGGAGSYVYIYSGYVTENNGDIMAMGATGDATISGSDGAQYIEIQSYVGTTHNSGNLNVSGGDGASGGSAGYIYIYSDSGYAGAMMNSGDLTANGGNALAATGNGGNGNWIGLYNYGSDIISSGNLSVAGGDGTVAGADGGSVDSGIDIYADSGSAAWNWGEAARPAGDIIISGNIDISGGDALAASTADGGDAGYLDVWNDAEYNGQSLTGDSVIALKGYTSISARGGDGNYPGDGDDIDLEAYYGWDERLYIYTAGPVLNEADLDLSGGDAPATSTGDQGGSSYGLAGDIWIATGDTYGYGMADLTVTNLGDIDASAGNAFNRTSTADDGGYVGIFGTDGITNRGSINTSGSSDIGADGAGTNGYGGRPAYIELYAEGPIASSGDLTSNGGDGEYRGGNAYGSWIFGTVLKVSGAISGNGGNADAALAGSVGGSGVSDGHYVIPAEAGSTITATFSYAGGSGETAGAEGYAVVAGACEGDC
jgi:hypothetical protein